MIACVLSDVGSAMVPLHSTVLEDSQVGILCVFEHAEKGNIFVDNQRGIAVAGEGLVFNAGTGAKLVKEVFDRYTKDGIDGLITMRGAFAVIVYDSQQHELVAMMDPLASRSLFYEHMAGKFAISTDLSWFKKERNGTNLDPVYMATFIMAGRRPSGRTPFRRVRRIPLGTFLRWKSSTQQETLKKYWWPVPQKTLPDNLCASRLNEVMTETMGGFGSWVDSTAVCLSGGLDSSYVYAIMARVAGRPPLAFHWTFKRSECDELEYARAVVNHYGGKLVLLDAGKLWPFQNFPNWPSPDEPLSNTVQTPELIGATASEYGVCLILNGAGGDDLFDTLWEYAFHDILRFNRPLYTLGLLRKEAKAKRLSFTDAMKSLVWQFNPEPLLSLPSEFLTSLIREHYSSLPRLRGKGWVQKSVELSLLHARPAVRIVQSQQIVINPLFEPQVVEIAASIRGIMKRWNGHIKIALREAARPFLPDKVVDRKKDPRQLPFFVQGLQREWPLIEQHFCGDARVYDVGFVNREAFMKTLTAFRGGYMVDVAKILKVLACEVWLSKD